MKGEIEKSTASEFPYALERKISSSILYAYILTVEANCCENMGLQ